MKTTTKPAFTAPKQLRCHSIAQWGITARLGLNSHCRARLDFSAHRTASSGQNARIIIFVRRTQRLRNNVHLGSNARVVKRNGVVKRNARRVSSGLTEREHARSAQRGIIAQTMVRQIQLAARKDTFVRAVRLLCNHVQRATCVPPSLRGGRRAQAATTVPNSPICPPSHR